MNTKNPAPKGLNRSMGMSVIDLLTTVGVASIVLTVLMSFYLFALRGVGAIGNYTQMDGKSQQAVDLMLREVREANLVVDYQNKSSGAWLKLANTTVSPSVTNTFTWDPTTGYLTWDKTGQATRILLSGCDDWTFTFYIRVPDSNGVFYSTTDASACKLINMSWKCSRTNIKQKMNTESVVTAEVVLRNKA